jgi:tRNA pseudouridine38-40 synthase
LCQASAVVYGAGRTDAGVHAIGQVAHVDLIKDLPADKVRDALNFYLRLQPIVIARAELVDEEFHARFSATGRSYLYRILNRRAPAALERGHVWHVPHLLDAAAMHEAAQELIGHHDFTSFRSTECQAPSPVKTLDELRVSRAGEEIHVVAKARSFLHNQVRIMVGTLKLVGDGKWSAGDVAKALAAADRTKGGPTAPPDGLYLTEVRY